MMCSQSNTGRRAARTAQATACGSSSPTLTQELYAPATIRSTRTAVCCDNCQGCRSCNAAMRNAYWPRFCHPRWLSCSQLYNGRCRLP